MTTRTVRAFFIGGAYVSDIPEGYMLASVLVTAEGTFHTYVPSNQISRTSPTEEDIVRRVDLLVEAETRETFPYSGRPYCRVEGKFYWQKPKHVGPGSWKEIDEATFRAGLRSYAIRDLLNQPS